MAKYRYLGTKPMVLVIRNVMIPLIKNTVVELDEEDIKTRRLRKVLEMVT